MHTCAFPPKPQSRSECRFGSSPGSGIGSIVLLPFELFEGLLLFAPPRKKLNVALPNPPSSEGALLFALAFVPIRSIYWLFVSHAFWTDTISLPIKEANSLIAFYLANLGLTGLQLLWTGKIIDGVKGKLGGGKAKKKDLVALLEGALRGNAAA